jgi:hypothetical protein
MKTRSTVPDIFYDENFDVSGIIRLNLKLFQNLRFEVGYNHGFVPFSRIAETGVNGNLLREAKLGNQHLSLIAAFRL